MSAIGDGAYDSKANFRYLHDSGIEPVIRVRKNSSLKAMGCMPRKLVVQEQLADYGGWWRRRHRYGSRWRVEPAISSFKASFGRPLS